MGLGVKCNAKIRKFMLPALTCCYAKTRKPEMLLMLL